jgi:ribosomal protein S18 acetylase RimI-like enzyme
VRLRLATNADVERVKEIRHRAYSAHAPVAYSAREVENLLGDLDEDELVAMIAERQLFVAVVDGEVQGVAGWMLTYVRHVYVAPGRERTGIGSQLLARVEHDFRGRTEAREVQVGAVVYARAFYEANGYTVLRQEAAWDGSSFFRMTKEL